MAPAEAAFSVRRERVARAGTSPKRSGPLRLPDWPPSFLTTFGAATPSQSRVSVTDLRSQSLHAVLNTPVTGSGARWLASCAFPRGSAAFLVTGRVGVHVVTFEACSSFTRGRRNMIGGAAWVVTAEKEEMRAAMRHLFSDTHNTAEGVWPPRLRPCFKTAGAWQPGGWR